MEEVAHKGKRWYASRNGTGWLQSSSIGKWGSWAEETTQLCSDIKGGQGDQKLGPGAEAGPGVQAAWAVPRAARRAVWPDVPIRRQTSWGRVWGVMEIMMGERGQVGHQEGEGSRREHR